jgi:radical SAM family uncharacterized protein/radical SAM-linked protein
MAFPDTYEVGMSHLGVRILYHLLNSREGIACDRAYAPWLDMEALMRQHKIPLCSHEASAPLREFDLVGFSLTYELCYTNVLNMLELAGIPLLSEDRDEGDWPLVLGGGPCAGNPEPVAPFFDAFLFGDGEEAVVEICETAMAWKESRAGRQELLSRLADIEGVYVPRFFEPEYDDKGRIKRIKSLKNGRGRVKRRIVADLETAYFPKRPLTPVIEPVHDRISIEIARGCSRGCRFCHAGIIYRPVRERSVDKVLGLAAESLSATGYEECSLLSLSAGDHSCISQLLVALVREHYSSRVSLSLPSLRVRGLSESMLKAIESVRKTGFTLAPEAATDRLRRVINKAYGEDELMETARRVFSHGWRNLKLYFMIGLPTETDDDVRAIIELGEKVARIKGAQGRPRTTLSLSGFVPKPHTPFQWESQAGAQRLDKIQERVRRAFTGRGRKVKWHDPGVSELEGVMSRGDRRVSAAILAAHRRGLRFDGWSECFDYQGWIKAFSETGIDHRFYTGRERGRDEVFPWEHLDPGVSREWLWEERERAFREESSEDCRETGCIRPCGVCDHESVMPRTAGKKDFREAEQQPEPARPGQPEVFFKYRVRYARRGYMRYMGQLEVTRLFVRAVRRAQLPMRYTRGYHQKPRVMFGPAPPVGVLSEAEYVDLELVRKADPDKLRDRLQNVMPEGIHVLEAHEIPMKSSPISAVVTGFDYVVRRGSGGPEGFDEATMKKFMDQESVVITQKREKGDREVDIRPLVKYLELGGDGEVRMGLRVVDGPGVKPQEAAAAAFGLDEEEARKLEIIRVGARFKEARPLRYRGRGERVRRARRVPGGAR